MVMERWSKVPEIKILAQNNHRRTATISFLIQQPDIVSQNYFSVEQKKYQNFIAPHHRACIFITTLSLHFSMTCLEYKVEEVVDAQDLTASHCSVSIRVLLINTKICCWTKITNSVVIRTRLSLRAKSLSPDSFVCQCLIAHRNRMWSMSLKQ